ncbi:putative phosphatidylserine synthase [Leptomonas pyrrhocoris]|uniref:Putative phosphatidylserine synthase n=1 Tax=Leptomonas pyrrhocoris TaxID=157538 RepID=A0A0M9FW64_LEPPY|nr:putative phosphatidylserine synthase [Leptomonas pyrrhocoris]KPA77330.1 putative phosphatidylserine synthase [Leptomonas pyrrhocoris]|eukprot:XP_015655769.1 putative phosphatidylserine synthase [Leptomonas pyrrhocoris]
MSSNGAADTNSGNGEAGAGDKKRGDKYARARPPSLVLTHPLDSVSVAHRTDDHVKPASPWVRELDFADRAYTPHTVAVLLTILVGLLLMLRYYYYPNLSVAQNVKLGLSAAAFVFIGFGTVHLPDSLMVRPHPAVWRGVLALGVLYLVFLTFMIFQDLPTVRMIMGYYDTSLLEPLPERAYAEDCRMSTAENPWLFVHTAFDMFILAHSLGYVVKMLVLRDWRVVTAVSLGFEVMEVTFQHVLPNFRECWWDHLLLDVLICNTGGMLVGMWLLRKLNAKEYKWIALKEIPTMRGKAKRLLGQFGPRSFERYNWNVFQSPTRFFQVAGILVLMMVQELNCFTLKAVLQMQPEYHLVTARLALWALLATSCLRELYEYMTNPHVKRIGTNAWVTILGICVESIWITKMAVEGHYFQDVAMPTHIAVPWMAAIASFAVWLVLYFGVLSIEQRNRRRGLAYCCVNVFFYAAALCILGLFLMGLPDLQVGRRTFEAAVAPYEKYIFVWR